MAKFLRIWFIREPAIEEPINWPLRLEIPVGVKQIRQNPINFLQNQVKVLSDEIIVSSELVEPNVDVAYRFIAGFDRTKGLKKIHEYYVINDHLWRRVNNGDIGCKHRKSKLRPIYPDPDSPDRVHRRTDHAYHWHINFIIEEPMTLAIKNAIKKCITRTTGDKK